MEWPLVVIVNWLEVDPAIEPGFGWPSFGWRSSVVHFVMTEAVGDRSPTIWARLEQISCMRGLFRRRNFDDRGQYSSKSRHW
jgi:hypothetical protein